MTTAAPSPEPGNRTSPWWFVPALSAGVAIATGLVEGPLAILRRELFALPIEADAHFFWMAGVGNLLLVLPVALLLWGVNRLRPGRRTEQIATGVILTLAAFALLAYVPRINRWGLLLIAAGIGIQASRVLMKQRWDFHRNVKRLAMAATVGLAVFAAMGFAWRPFRERWLNRALPAAPPGSPNVLLIVLDTVRSMRLSLYGYHKETTPELSRWAQSSTVFEEAVSTSPWTLPGHASMLTGRYAHEINAGFRTPMHRRWPTLGEVLARQGYLTAGFVANKIASYESGLGRGFAWYEDYLASGEQLLITPSLGRLLFTTVWQKARFPELLDHYDLYARKNATQVSQEFLRWIGRRDSTRPFFAFLNYYDAHDPYLPPPPFDRRFTTDTMPYRPPGLGPWLKPWQLVRMLEAHEGAIAYIDHEIGRLLDQLQARGILDSTLVIVTADHGEQFGEHNMTDHGNSLYRALLDVPLMLRFPGRVPAGERIETPVTMRDLPATVLDLAQLPNRRFPGSSLGRTWRARSSETKPESPLLSALSWPNGDIGYSLRVNGHHYIDWFQQKEELYDLENDPEELKNLARKKDRRITAGYRALRDSVVGRIDRPREVTWLQGRLTGLARQ